jgi:L,D-peptidoglycan transpeptidase YkuD (ErfK/YbiS/YcfS/YnhG family)
VFSATRGHGGLREDKSEGDGATPIGRFPLRQVFYRPDRLTPLLTGLPVRPLTPNDGWCDDPSCPDYNRLVSLPHPSRHETLWREDALYDIVVVVGYNDAPPIPGRGSAIFLHLQREEGSPTEGCLGLRQDDLLRLLEGCDPNTELVINP